MEHDFVLESVGGHVWLNSVDSNGCPNNSFQL